MTAPDLAAALLRDVRLFVPEHDGLNDPDEIQGTLHGWCRMQDVLAALTAALDGVDERAGEVLEGVTPGPWRVDGEPWNQIVWSGADNRVCFMAHSNGLDDDRDVATARFIAWCREGVPALISLATAQAAQIAGLEAKARESAMQELASLGQAQEAYEAQLAAEAKVAKMQRSRDRYREAWEAEKRRFAEARAATTDAAQVDHEGLLDWLGSFPPPNDKLRQMYADYQSAISDGRLKVAPTDAAQAREAALKKAAQLAYEVWDDPEALAKAILALIGEERT